MVKILTQNSNSATPNFATPQNFGTLIEIKLTKYAERIASDDRMEKVLSDCRVTAEAFYRSRTADEMIPY
jgi:hypothetical protein